MKKSNSLLLSLLCASLLVACNGGSSSSTSTLTAQQYANSVTTEINSLFNNGSSSQAMGIAFSNNNQNAFIWYTPNLSTNSITQQLISFTNNQWNTVYTTSSYSVLPNMTLSNNGTLYLGGVSTNNMPQIASFNGSINNIVIPSNLQESGAINSIAVDSNNVLYAAQESTILVLNNNSWSTISAPSQLFINKIVIDSNNNLYMLANNSLYKYVNNSWTQISTPIAPNNIYLDSVAFNHGTFYLLYANYGINGAIYGSPLAGLNESSPNNWSLLIESQLQGSVAFNGDIEADYYGNVYVDVGPNAGGGGSFDNEYFLALPASTSN